MGAERGKYRPAAKAICAAGAWSASRTAMETRCPSHLCQMNLNFRVKQPPITFTMCKRLSSPQRTSFNAKFLPRRPSRPRNPRAIGGSAPTSGDVAAEDDAVFSMPQFLKVAPNPLLSASEALVAQLEALRCVHQPCGDLRLLPLDGLEVLYRFAAIDPFCKGSLYFGARRSANVAYFSQFSAKFSTRDFHVLLGLTDFCIASALHRTQHRFCARVLVTDATSHKQAVFSFNLVKWQGGQLDGCWLTESIVREEGPGGQEDDGGMGP